MSRLGSAVVLLCMASGACAQLVVYKVIETDGRTTYSDRSESAQAPQDNPAEAEAPPAAEPKRPAIPSRLALQVNASEAKRRLAQAELKRKHGKQPLPGEYQHAAGGNKVNYRYWQRQEKLRVEVEQAQRRFNATQPHPVLARQ